MNYRVVQLNFTMQAQYDDTELHKKSLKVQASIPNINTLSQTSLGFKSSVDAYPHHFYPQVHYLSIRCFETLQ